MEGLGNLPEIRFFRANKMIGRPRYIAICLPDGTVVVYHRVGSYSLRVGSSGGRTPSPASPSSR
jgi:hypothetical protein